MKARLSSTGKLRLRNGLLALALAGVATAPAEPTPTTPSDPPPVGDGSVVLTLVDIDKDQRLFQHVAGFYDVPVEGTTSGTSPVQARAIDAYTGAVVVDWTTIATPINGNYAGGLRCPKRISPCKLEVRDSVNTASKKAGVNRFYVGVHGIIWGQSNAVNWPGGVYHYPNGGKGALVYKSGTFRRLGWILDTYPPSLERSGYGTGTTYPGGSATDNGGDKGDGFVYVANILSEAIGCAVCLTVSASGGQPLSYWAPGATGWTELTAALAAIGGDAEFAVLYQGEADADGASTTQSGYLAQLVARQTQFHNATGRNASTFKFGVVGLGATNANGTYADSMDKVRAAQIQFVNSTPGAFLFAANHDCRTSDGIHVNGSSYSHLGAAGGRTLAALYGFGPSGAGPRVISASRVGPVIDMNVQHAGGTALLDGEGGTGAALKGFRVFLASDTNKTNELPQVSTGIPSATKIRVTLASDPGAPIVIDYGMTPAPHSPDGISAQVEPVFASAVYDNVALVNQVRGCILQPFAAIAVTGS